MELLLLKVLSVIFIVLFLTYIAENISVKISGLISGLPTGSLLTFIFFAYEFGVVYVQNSVLFTINGLISNVIFCVGYYFSTFYNGRFKLLFSLFVASIFYALSMLLLLQYEPSFELTPILVFFVLITIVLYFQFKDDHLKLEKKKLTIKAMTLRIALTIAIFVTISSLPLFVPVSIAGFFAAFPIVLLPLLLIIHFTYGNTQARTIAKNAPLGMPSVIVFALMVHYTYGNFGIILGTIISLLSSAVALYLQQKFLSLFRKRFIYTKENYEVR